MNISCFHCFILYLLQPTTLTRKQENIKTLVYVNTFANVKTYQHHHLPRLVNRTKVLITDENNFKEELTKNEQYKLIKESVVI